MLAEKSTRRDCYLNTWSHQLPCFTGAPAQPLRSACLKVYQSIFALLLRLSRDIGRPLLFLFTDDPEAERPLFNVSPSSDSVLGSIFNLKDPKPAANEKMVPFLTAINENVVPSLTTINEKVVPFLTARNEKMVPFLIAKKRKGGVFFQCKNEKVVLSPTIRNEKGTPPFTLRNEKMAPLPSARNEKTVIFH